MSIDKNTFKIPSVINPVRQPSIKSHFAPIPREAISFNYKQQLGDQLKKLNSE